MAGPEPSRRPRLSLQTKSVHNSSGRTRHALANANPRSPTAFNTLSNVYVTAIERSTPTQSTPLTAFKVTQPLKLQTDANTLQIHQQRVQTPFTATLPDTPLSANPMSPAQQMDIIFPSTMTATPPLSAGPVESSERRVFNFASEAFRQIIPTSPAQARRRVTYASSSIGGANSRGAPGAPYSHNRGLHSILRNSPLPPSSAKSPSSPRRQSLRLQEKAARRVGYESPLTQTITTELYTKSHIDLLAEEASPYTPFPIVEDSEMVLDLAMAYSGNETRDGGMTPGPFEEMRRRMTKLATETPIHSPRPDGMRKRKRKEKKRKWVWTIGQDDEENDGVPTSALGESTPRATRPSLIAQKVEEVVKKAITKATTPEPLTAVPLTAVQISVEPIESESEMPTTDDRMDFEMSDTASLLSSRATTPFSVDLDMKTPTVAAPSGQNSTGVRRGSTGPTYLRHSSTSPPKKQRLGSVDLINPDTGSRRDTPIPPDLVEVVEERGEEHL
ncbi:hypothetical protein F5Y16DRAFT_253037 [Xylariaceae sp. FL0255]|nr:hypothetical protein F5Y16DRAFT_253037 [Xylariaceae sp. FL0255]